jgi:hypothetical protein
MLDLLTGEPTELTRLKMVRTQPLPSRLSRSPTWACRPPAGPWADRQAGRRNLWLRALDAAGLGFDS